MIHETKVNDWPDVLGFIDTHALDAHPNFVLKVSCNGNDIHIRLECNEEKKSNPQKKLLILPGLYDLYW